MENARRDLAQQEHWLRSLERSRVRRELAPRARRELKRTKSMAASVAAAVAAGPGVSVAAAQMTTGSSPAALASPEGDYTVELREGGLPLEVGDTGELVAQVQKHLGIAADGIFGFQTDAAVRQFQLRANLTVDGIVGPATWAALFPQARGAAVGGSNVPPQVKRGVERTLVEAAQRVAVAGGGATGTRGQIKTGAGVRTGSGVDTATGVDKGTSVETGIGGDSGAQTGGGAPETGGGAPETGARTPAPVGGGACESTISSPVRGTVTSPFGPRGGRNHDGVDIAAPMGTAIRAAACGTVSLAGQQSGYGNIVCITHTSRFSTCYAHLSRFAVSNGQQVQQGQVIGYVGCTGNCTGPHLHFETRIDGAARDPSTYLGGATIPGAAPRTSSATAAIGGGSARATTIPVAEYERTSTAAASEGVEQDSFTATTAEPVASAAVEPTPTMTTAAPAPAPTSTTAPSAPAPEPTTTPTTAPTTTAPAPEPTTTTTTPPTAPTTTAPAPEPTATTTAPTTTAPAPEPTATTTTPTTTAPAPEPTTSTTTPTTAPTTTAPTTTAPAAEPTASTTTTVPTTTAGDPATSAAPADAAASASTTAPTGGVAAPATTAVQSDADVTLGQ